jgi:hypothetical protein
MHIVSQPRLRRLAALPSPTLGEVARHTLSPSADGAWVPGPTKGAVPVAVPLPDAWREGFAVAEMPWPRKRRAKKSPSVD